ncbi:MAG: type 1 glutamine amidotransferase [Pedobacter sp.]|nr:MAG: type 1 glutamine amidotransferase [Pedobacter sp.]
MGRLNNKKIAILSESGFEESELNGPVLRLREEGAVVHIISSKEGKIKGWKDGNWASEVSVDVTLSSADPKEYDGIVLPGGVINPDKLRVNNAAVEFVKAFFEAGKPVAAICHGPQTLINADVVDGRKLTSVHAISMDLINAGAIWVDEEVVVDQGLVTSRTPEDLPAFLDKMVEEFAEGIHEGQHV